MLWDESAFILASILSKKDIVIFPSEWLHFPKKTLIMDSPHIAHGEFNIRTTCFMKKPGMHRGPKMRKEQEG